MSGVSGLMVTSAVIYHVLNFLNITIDVRNVCVFLAPLFASFTTIVTFFLTKELKVGQTACVLKSNAAEEALYAFQCLSTVITRLQGASDIRNEKLHG